MSFFENCKTRTIKSKTGRYDEQTFVIATKGLVKKYNGEAGFGQGKGKTIKSSNCDSSSTTRNKKYLKETFSKTGKKDENKLMLFN